jgi:hypothetical protein
MRSVIPRALHLRSERKFNALGNWGSGAQRRASTLGGRCPRSPSRCERPLGRWQRALRRWHRRYFGSRPLARALESSCVSGRRFSVAPPTLASFVPRSASLGSGLGGRGEDRGEMAPGTARSRTPDRRHRCRAVRRSPACGNPLRVPATEHCWEPDQLFRPSGQSLGLAVRRRVRHQPRPARKHPVTQRQPTQTGHKGDKGRLA